MNPATAQESEQEVEQEVEQEASGSTRGSWEPSYITEKEINWLQSTRRIPPEVVCRIPAGEAVPAPEQGEHVVFLSHFERGLGLPASRFFRAFLDKFHLKPHHLPPNAIVFLSSFVAFEEGYLGLWLNLDLFIRLHCLAPQSALDGRHSRSKSMVECGAAMIKPRTNTEFFRVKGLGSVKKWVRSWFYVKNADPKVDRINLPSYMSGPPIEKHNWDYYPADNPELLGYIKHIQELHDDGKLSPDDLVATFVSRRVSPLQRQSHKICHMSGRRDPNRTSTFALSKSDIRTKVKAICVSKMGVDWEWGLEPFSRKKPTPAVRPSFPFPLTSFELFL